MCPALGGRSRPWRGQRCGLCQGQHRERVDGDWGASLTGGLLSPPCRAVGQMMSTMFYPLFTFVLLLVCVAYWAMTALYPLPT